jgi:hypothetical protein
MDQGNILPRTRVVVLVMIINRLSMIDRTKSPVTADFAILLELSMARPPAAKRIVVIRKYPHIKGTALIS